MSLAHFEATRAARFERYEAVRAARQPVFDVIALQSARRAADVASWAVDRGWPIQRLREAFAVWRYGEAHVAEHSWDIAGRIGHEDLDRLRRAAARYERHADARPAGYPAGGLAALAEISIVAGERDARPQRLHYAIRALDQLSRRMRASDTVDDAERLARRARRARQRVSAPAAAPTTPFTFRTPAPGGRWPRWLALDANGEPLLTRDGELVARRDAQAPAGYEHQPWVAPPRGSALYLEAQRDVFLLRGLWPPLEADGRSKMAAGDERSYDGSAAQRRAIAGPYALPEAWRERPDPEDLELAQLAPAMWLQRVQRLDVDVRDRLLRELRARRRDANAARADLGRAISEQRDRDGDKS